MLSWYFERKLRKNEVNLKNLKATKKQILEDVMDKETYKVAKEILEKFAPEQLNKDATVIIQHYSYLLSQLEFIFNINLSTVKIFT